MAKYECRVCFDSFEEEIKTIFSTEYIVNCYAQGSTKIYDKFFSYQNVKELMSNKELVKMIKVFLKSNLVIIDTAKKCFLHKNTLIYKFKKIKKLISLDIRNFKDALLINNMLIVYKNR